MRKYSYSGPVMEFDRCVENKWTGETMATTENRARSNLAHQWKKGHNRTASSNIRLPGKITEVRE